MEEIDGLKILSGINTHPGSGTLNDHTSEIKMFSDILNNIDNKDNPVMIELGSFWALWSLLFKIQYSPFLMPTQPNILLEE